MKLRVEITGDLRNLTKREVALGEAAVTQTMRAAAQALKTRWRQDVAGAGLGTKLSNAIRSDSYPKGEASLNAAAMVWTKAPKIIGAHQEGALIRSRDGFWLAIPTPAAGKGRRGGRISPGEWERRTGRTLRFVFRRGRPALLVDDGTITPGNAPAFGERKRRGFRNRTVPIFVLVPQVKLPKRLDLYASAEQVAASIPAAIAAKWGRS